ncbi:1-acyl-sn-glycerol-3-phosphate acyltransferase [Sphingomonas sabuli]|uniref:1-acyl-sn-glycerol-3-phosphate acyltransferase n=1 Tax=Sphingomonas sabuli TaxID=2764186 RepID=A0A7G9L559_9SPHN|nr:lysophospholipid acyltransferase family protein [Sphingomonas sabuli]QNM83758.1 1-acyl-sn-glycerol-3-phosphate acyltransferase [Sphingomonas sabuli]
MTAVAVLRLVALAVLLMACLPPHLLSKALLGRSRWPQRFLTGVAWICGARIRVEGTPPSPRTLLACNHTSWLDIPVMAAATGCAFVSKAELGHPAIHWLADQNATLYVRREERRNSHAQAQAIASQLRNSQPLALFPEGTTGPGTHLLPFRSTLFAAVTPLPDGAVVRPVAIDFGPAAAEIGWVDEPGLDNVLRMLGRTRPIPVTVRLLDPLPPSTDRKRLSEAARDAIESALFKSPRQSPIGKGQ